MTKPRNTLGEFFIFIIIDITFFAISTRHALKIDKANVIANLRLGKIY